VGFDIVDLLLRAPVIFFSLTIHEFMHAWTAWKCGDDTAQRAGRLTLNPLAHLDPIGTIALFIGPIGWAKPVPVQFTELNYETRRRDEILITGAGVATNFAVAAALALLARFLVAKGLAPEPPGVYDQRSIASILWAMMGEAVFINFALAMFNLLPLYPLDGSHIMRNILPLNAAIVYHNHRKLTTAILAVIVLANWLVFGFLSWPVFRLMLLFAGADGASSLFIHMWV
jgi:Zn-dependent protease